MHCLVFGRGTVENRAEDTVADVEVKGTITATAAATPVVRCS